MAKFKAQAIYEDTPTNNTLSTIETPATGATQADPALDGEKIASGKGQNATKPQSSGIEDAPSFSREVLGAALAAGFSSLVLKRFQRSSWMMRSLIAVSAPFLIKKLLNLKTRTET